MLYDTQNVLAIETLCFAQTQMQRGQRIWIFTDITCSRSHETCVAHLRYMSCGPQGMCYCPQNMLCEFSQAFSDIPQKNVPWPIRVCSKTLLMYEISRLSEINPELIADRPLPPPSLTPTLLASFPRSIFSFLSPIARCPPFSPTKNTKWCMIYW